VVAKKINMKKELTKIIRDFEDGEISSSELRIKSLELHGKYILSYKDALIKKANEMEEFGNEFLAGGITKIGYKLALDNIKVHIQRVYNSSIIN
jgi:hypothetical protein